MTDKTFTFTIDQIKQIYQAGVRRGGDAQCAYDWGCRPSGNEYDECVEVIQDIANDGKKWDDPDWTDWKTVNEWFKDKRKD